jgi:hypothetical protein
MPVSSYLSSTHEFHRKYDPNQPRVPAGNSDGGQWTRDGSSAAARRVIRDWTGLQPWEAVFNNYQNGGSLFEQAVVNRDGSVIRSEFSLESIVNGWDERHSVLLPGGYTVVFENGLISNPPKEPEAEARIQPAYLPPPAPHPLALALAAAATLYTWLSTGTARMDRPSLPTPQQSTSLVKPTCLAGFGLDDCLKMN